MWNIPSTSHASAGIDRMRCDPCQWHFVLKLEAVEDECMDCDCPWDSGADGCSSKAAAAEGVRAAPEAIQARSVDQISYVHASILYQKHLAELNTD
jgi:hypothetical protein